MAAAGTSSAGLAEAVIMVDANTATAANVCAKHKIQK